MVRGLVTEMFNSALQESGNDQRKAGQIVASKIEKLIKDKKIRPEDVKFDQLAFELIPNLDSYRTGDVQELVNAVTSTQFPTISKVAINTAIMEDFELYSENADALVSEINGTRTDVEFVAGFTDPEGPEMRLETMSYEDTNFGERDIAVYMADFGRTISITREAIFNDRTGQLLDNARKIGEYGGQHRAKMIMQTLECNPRTAFKEPTGGSKAFTYKGTSHQVAAFYNATNHTSIDGRINANLVTSNALADYTDIQAAMAKFSAMKSPSGHDMVVMPKLVIVPEALEVAAWQILNTTNFAWVGQGQSAAPVLANAANPYGPGGIRNFRPHVSKYLSSSSTWYIGDPAKQLKWVWVYKPSTSSLAASSDKAFFNNIIMTYKFSYHGGAGNADYSYVVKNTA